jgi:hypothetical protein
MATRATLFDPTTGARQSVEVGSTNERSLFSKGFKLETPTQNYQTYQKPQREIFQGEGDSLVASDTGKQLSPAELSTAVNTGGYQDTRRTLNMQGAPDAAGASMSMATATNPAQSFQDAIGQLLINAQKGANTTDLQAQRNALINARFNSKTATTPEELRMLSPEQQSALRSGDVQGLNTQLAGVNTAITGRKEDAESALQFAGDMLDFSLKQQALTSSERADSIKAIGDLNDLYGSSWMDVVTADEKKRLETTLGISDLSQLKGIVATDPDRFQAIGATKYHGNLVFDKSTGTFVGADGKALSEAEISAMSKVAGGSGDGKTTTKASDVDRARALKLYNEAYGTNPAEGLLDYLVITMKEEEARLADKAKLKAMQDSGVSGPVKPTAPPKATVNPFRNTSPLNPGRPGADDREL